MKGNGVKIGFTIAFLAIAIYYLQFSVRNTLLERHIDSLSGRTRPITFSRIRKRSITYVSAS